MRVLKITVLAALLVMAASIAFAGPTYDRVMSSKVVKVGLSNQGMPFGFINDKNEWVGSTSKWPLKSPSVWAASSKSRCEQQHPYFLCPDQSAQG